MSDKREIVKTDDAVAPAARLVAATLRAANIVLADSAQDVDYNANRLACLFRKISTDTSAEAARLVTLQNHVTEGGDGSERMGLTNLPAVMNSCLTNQHEEISSTVDHQLGLRNIMAILHDQMADIRHYTTEVGAFAKQANDIAKSALAARRSVEKAGTPNADNGAQQVSRGMRRLAQRSQRVAGRVQTCQQNLDTKLDVLLEKMDADHEAMLAEKHNREEKKFSSRSQLAAFLESAKRQDQAAAITLETACRSARQFSSDIDTYLNSMHFQEELTDRFSSIIQALSAILEFVEINQISSDGMGKAHGEIVEIIGNINNTAVRERFHRAVLGSR